MAYSWLGALTTIVPMGLATSMVNVSAKRVSSRVTGSACRTLLMAVLTPVSWGEVIDKITILEIKSERLTDAAKIAVQASPSLRYTHFKFGDDFGGFERAVLMGANRLFEQFHEGTRLHHVLSHFQFEFVIE